ncbi:hypothetical protein [Actinoplanes campanulatus]|uniref:hypothetical protein n=1 Tax=Actinoplanes campanulatus TaxID=113559 RepID=UPI001EF2D4E5|nr:hypothetical protein [Actinoplanes capillaceus]
MTVTVHGLSVVVDEVVSRRQSPGSEIRCGAHPGVDHCHGDVRTTGRPGPRLRELHRDGACRKNLAVRLHQPTELSKPHTLDAAQDGEGRGGPVGWHVDGDRGKSRHHLAGHHAIAEGSKDRGRVGTAGQADVKTHRIRCGRRRSRNDAHQKGGDQT